MDKRRKNTKLLILGMDFLAHIPPEKLLKLTQTLLKEGGLNGIEGEVVSIHEGAKWALKNRETFEKILRTYKGVLSNFTVVPQVEEWNGSKQVVVTVISQDLKEKFPQALRATSELAKQLNGNVVVELFSL